MNLSRAPSKSRTAPALRLDGGVSASIAKAAHAWNRRPLVYCICPEEPTGYETHVLIKLGQREIAAIIGERATYAPRDVINIFFASPVAHFFDPATGPRLTS